MIWAQQLCDDIEQLAPRGRDWSRALTLAHVLSEICDQHVPDAPKPVVELPPGEGAIEIGWIWRKVERTLTFYVSGTEVTMAALDKQASAHVESPTEAEVSTFVRSFFEGYHPQ